MKKLKTKSELFVAHVQRIIFANPGKFRLPDAQVAAAEQRARDAEKRAEASREEARILRSFFTWCLRQKDVVIPDGRGRTIMLADYAAQALAAAGQLTQNLPKD